MSAITVAVAAVLVVLGLSAGRSVIRHALDELRGPPMTFEAVRSRAS